MAPFPDMSSQRPLQKGPSEVTDLCPPLEGTMAPHLSPLSQEVRKKSLHLMPQKVNPRIPEVAQVAQGSLPGMVDGHRVPAPESVP